MDTQKLTQKLTWMSKKPHGWGKILQKTPKMGENVGENAHNE